MTDYSELKRLAEAANAVTSDVNVEMTLASESGPNQAEIDAVTAFMDMATPAAVLALIADIEYLTESRLEAREERNKIGDRHDALEAERDQLKAENAGLKTGYEAYERVNAELKAEVEALMGELSRLRAKHGDFSTGPSSEDAPYLFSIALDMSTCTIDRNGEPFHFDSSERYLEALKDAERYRFMRHHSCVFRSGLPGHEPVSESDFDADCDAAMSKGDRS